jgi:hypothetical protein
MMVSRGSPSLVSADATTATTVRHSCVASGTASARTYSWRGACPGCPLGITACCRTPAVAGRYFFFFFLRNRTSLIKAQHCYKTIQQIVLTRTGKAKRLNKLLPPLMACCARLCFFSTRKRLLDCEPLDWSSRTF